jgi:hypothetical protein
MKKFLLPVVLASMAFTTAAVAAGSTPPLTFNNNTYKMLLVTITDMATDNPIATSYTLVGLKQTQTTFPTLPTVYTVSWCWTEDSSLTTCDPSFPPMSCPPPAKGTLTSVQVNGGGGLRNKLSPWQPMSFTCNYSK